MWNKHIGSQFICSEEIQKNVQHNTKRTYFQMAKLGIIFTFFVDFIKRMKYFYIQKKIKQLFSVDKIEIRMY